MSVGLLDGLQTFMHTTVLLSSDFYAHYCSAYSFPWSKICGATKRLRSNWL